jgi:antitoxin (DNA-binding transcriptional repressor) of toxin-antitoxin stability system
VIRINIGEARLHLAKHLRRAAKTGDVITLCRLNVPVAEIRPLKPPVRSKRPIGLAKGKAKILPSFFDPLPDDLLDSFEGKQNE